MSAPGSAEPASATSMVGVLRRILAFVLPHRTTFLGSLAYLVLALAADLAGPLILGIAIDLLLAHAAAPDTASRGRLLDEAFLCGWAFLVVGLAGQCVNLRKEVLKTRLATNVLSDIRVRLYDAIQRLDVRYHDANHSGDLITRATRDVYHVHTLYAETVFLGAEIVLMVGGSAVLIALADWRLALFSFATFPVAATVIVRAAERMRRLSRAASDQYDAVTRVLQESISGVRVVKAFAREPAEIDKFDRETGGYLERTLASIHYFTLNLPLAATLFNLSIPITLAGGAYLHAAGQIGVGRLAAAVFYLAKISNVLRLLNRVVQTLQEAASGGDRVFGILDATPGVREPTTPVPLPPGGRGEVTFEDVSFAYRPDTPVLRSITLRLPAGRRTAIVGPTGAGKSTLASLLPRFHDPTAGCVRLDGVDVRKLSLRELRQAVSPIFQDTFLFSMSIAENIAYGVPDASAAQIEQAAGAAQIHDFIASLERGYDTIVGERGVSLSGGQKQRIAIARAFLRNPRVLLMDDCTASVDAETEKRLQEAMLSLSAGRTTLIIAQRFSSVAAADQIVWLEAGRIVAAGTHEELLSSSPAYAEQYALQVQVTTGAAPAGVAP